MRIAYPAAAAALLLAASAQAATTTYSGSQSTITYAKTTTGASGYGNYARATSSVVYDPATDTYTVRDTGNIGLTSAFAPANISASNATFTTYSKNGGTETFRRLNQGGANPLIALTYVDYGQWRRTSTANGVTSVNDTYLVWGTRSPSSAVSSGGATYSTVVDGTFVNKTGSYAVSGTGSFVADFTNRAFTYSTTASATPETTGTAFSFGTMDGTGSIAVPGSSFKGTGSYNVSGYAMDVAGNFYGPAADEIGGLFRIRTAARNGGGGEGAIVGN